MSEWQPIETAPKDGRMILVWRDSGVHLMRWKAIGEHGFWDEWHVKLKHLSSHPTHWMPLPDPPSSAPQETP
jgi:hypothetical protein